MAYHRGFRQFLAVGSGLEHGGDVIGLLWEIRGFPLRCASLLLLSGLLWAVPETRRMPGIFMTDGKIVPVGGAVLRVSQEKTSGRDRSGGTFPRRYARFAVFEAFRARPEFVHRVEDHLRSGMSAQNKACRGGIAAGFVIRKRVFRRSCARSSSRRRR